MPGFRYVLAIIFIFALGGFAQAQVVHRSSQRDTATAMKDGFFSSFKIVGKAVAPAGK
jgi:hypothetical protein